MATSNDQRIALVGDETEAKEAFASIARKYRGLAKEASALRARHDLLLSMRQEESGDLLDVEPLRQPRSSSDD